MKTILVDFDGVIHQYTSPWTDATTISDPPVKGAFVWLTQAIEVFKVCVYSSRSKEEGGIDAMKKWFLHYALPQKVLDQLTFPTTKPAAHMTIDDRAFCFEGKWPDLEAVKAFVPWNKRR